MSRQAELALPEAAAPTPLATPPLMRVKRNSPLIIGLASVIGVLLFWELAADVLVRSFLLPSPSDTVEAFARQLEEGELLGHVAASMTRLAGGWVIGSVAGVPIGLLMASSRSVRAGVEPLVHFLRFIPVIAWITPFTVWWGIGELTKILLIVYVATFLVMLNTMAGVSAIPQNRVRAARSFGASPLQLFIFVRLPSVVPFAITGMRLAMGSGFMVLVSAEMVASQQGLGFLIINSRTYLATDLIFVGMLTLGALGLGADWLFRSAATRFAGPLMWR